MNEDRGSKSDSSWRNAMVSVGLAFSLPGTIAGPTIIGYFLDKHFGTQPVLLIVGLFIGLISAGVEISILIKRMG
jgi:F0F1-type ATP synthase assembly protein I